MMNAVIFKTGRAPADFYEISREEYERIMKEQEEQDYGSIEV